MIKNKEYIKLDVPARLVDDCRTYVPLRAVSEALGCMVRWDDEYSIVDIIDDSNLPDKWHVGTYLVMSGLDITILIEKICLRMNMDIFLTAVNFLMV